MIKVHQFFCCVLYACDISLMNTPTVNDKICSNDLFVLTIKHCMGLDERKRILLHVNIKGTEQTPAHSRRLISAFIIYFLSGKYNSSTSLKLSQYSSSPLKLCRLVWALLVCCCLSIRHFDKNCLL